MEEQLLALLTGVAGGAVSWGKAPQKAGYPRAVLTRIGGTRDYHMRAPSGLVSSRVQADCYAKSYNGAKAVAGAIRSIVNGRRDSFFQGIFIDAERDLPADDGADTLYRVTLDLLIHHPEEES